MILYEVLYDNGDAYGDNIQISKVFSTLEKAKKCYEEERYGYPSYYDDETVTLSSFDDDDYSQKKTRIAKRVLPLSPEFITTEDFV